MSFYLSGCLVLTRFEWVQWSWASWLIIHSSSPLSPPSQQPWPWPVSECQCQPFTSQQQFTFLSSITYYLHLTQYSRNIITLCEEKYTSDMCLPDNITKYHNNEGDRFFTGTDSVYDLQGQWKFFAMGSFVNWAEIWWMYVGVGVGVGLHIIDLVMRVTRKKTMIMRVNGEYQSDEPRCLLKWQFESIICCWSSAPLYFLSPWQSWVFPS